MNDYREQREVRHGERHGVGRPVARVLARAVLGLCTAVALTGLVPAGNSVAVAGSSDLDGGVVSSTGTVVVAKPGSTRVIRNVGTSTVTVRPGATVRQTLGRLTASDRSRQSRAIVDASGAVRRDGPVVAGDRLTVRAEDGRTEGSYALAVYDPGAAGRDGAYWNQPLYDRIDSTVNAHVPVFPDRRCDITDPAYRSQVRRVTERYAVGNEAGDPVAKTSPLVYDSQRVWFYGNALNAAIKDCHDAGGGTVVVPPRGSLNENGAYYSGAINLLSGVNLRVETGAVVKFMRDKTNQFYPVVRTSYEGTDLYSYSPLIYALHQHDIAVSGGGTLDGQEDMWNWRPWKKGYWGEPSVEDKDLDGSYGQNGVLNRMNFEDTPVEQRLFSDDGHLPKTIPVVEDGQVRHVTPPAGAKAMKSTFRPSFIQPNESTNVLIEDVKIRNTPFWIVHPLSSANVLVRGLDIYSDKTKGFEVKGWNNDDGIDPESSHDVVMEHNHVTVSDDGAAVKAGRNVNGREHRTPSERIIIRDSDYRNEAGNSAAISMGSEMSGGIRDIFIHDNVFGGHGLAMALKIKTNSTRGGAVENIYLRDSLLQYAVRSLIELDSDYNETVPFPNADAFDPQVRNIYLDRVDTGPGMPPATTSFSFRSAASRSPVENVRYRDSVYHSTSTLAAGFADNKNIKDLVVDNVTYINPQTGATTRYDTTPLHLLDATRAVPDTGDAISLIAADAGRPDTVTPVAGRTFRIAGAVDLSTAPDFPRAGTLRILVDRDDTPVPVHVRADGTFLSEPVTLDNDQSWYRDRHYVAVNFWADNGIDINTSVYQVAVSTQRGRNRS
ncbi:glycosyl hydrolase family 28 protein [Streptomyces sp. NBC_00056]|uniref:glycoside hydrolase family 28 protein n=1 Tax=Streptomyces sp. NBC_00056 TaxID=2975633 RepID=UPI00324372E1